MDNSAALRLIFRKKETIFFCFETLFPLYIDFNDVFCCIDVRKRANASDGARSSTASSDKAEDLG